ncbi:hypothetical protein ACSQ67_006181 [Phaseolus vulgaris]
MGVLKGSVWGLLMIVWVWKLAAGEEEKCENRWIHIRRLPSRFNLDLLANCSELFHAGTHLPPSDAGVPVPHARSLPRKGNLSPLLRRPRRPPLPLRSRIKLQRLTWPPPLPLPTTRQPPNLGPPHGPRPLPRHGPPRLGLLPTPHQRPSHLGHLLPRAVPIFNLTALTLEARAWPWQEHAVPYPTSFHPPSLGLLESWLTRVRRSKRSILALFAGGGGGGGGGSSTPNVRRSIHSECENATSDPSYEKLCEIVDCSNGVCEHDPIRFMRPMLQASFCLQPPGDTPTRRSTFDAILAGCIPVFFEELSAKSQYGWHLPENEYEDFSVLIPKEEVVFRGLRILNVLQRIPRAKVRSLRQRVLTLIPNVLYRKHDSSPGLEDKKDAFDLAIDGTLDKIRSRVEKLDSVI